MNKTCIKMQCPVHCKVKGTLITTNIHEIRMPILISCWPIMEQIAIRTVILFCYQIKHGLFNIGVFKHEEIWFIMIMMDTNEVEPLEKDLNI